ncbi:hypothetical protein E3J49_01265 [Candidatus Bathyarchaeota archaeon]|nr:coenzyme F420-0:L-glutamate ligase [Candidatus Bathyarchaeota archaeon]TET65586.1 MAG: hypothetical protein E3J49_01265 [Candidatus Bathyarchaeota archaeon]
MKLCAIRTGIVKTGENLVVLILESLKRQNQQLEDGDLLALASKIVAYTEGRVTKLCNVKPSARAITVCRFLSSLGVV